MREVAIREIFGCNKGKDVHNVRLAAKTNNSVVMQITLPLPHSANVNAFCAAAKQHSVNGP